MKMEPTVSLAKCKQMYSHCAEAEIRNYPLARSVSCQVLYYRGD